jgi:peroxin-5
VCAHGLPVLPAGAFVTRPPPCRLMKTGDLKQAILCFEAAVQRAPDNAEAWRFLVRVRASRSAGRARNRRTPCVQGQAHAENENEPQAIAALLRAVQVDPYNLEVRLRIHARLCRQRYRARRLCVQALMMLGVSYTNDLEEARALNYLKTWLLNNPDYQVRQCGASAQTQAEC